MVETLAAQLGLETIGYFVAMFATIFIVAYAFWGQAVGLTGLSRTTLCSSSMSSVHGAVTTLLAISQIIQLYPFHLDDVNSSLQRTTMQISTAYMFADLFFFLLPNTPDDYLFIGHHILTASYMLQSMWVGRGGISCLILMALGEVTSPLQNSWLILRFLKGKFKCAAGAFPYVSTVYTIVFVMIRTLLGPPIISWFVWSLLTNSPLLPGYCRWGWSFIATLATTGSQLWSYKLAKGLLKLWRRPKAI